MSRKVISAKNRAKKAFVKSYSRKTKSGKTVRVRAYEKNLMGSSSLPINMNGAGTEFGKVKDEQTQKTTPVIDFGDDELRNAWIAFENRRRELSRQRALAQTTKSTKESPTNNNKVYDYSNIFKRQRRLNEETKKYAEARRKGKSYTPSLDYDPQDKSKVGRKKITPKPIKLPKKLTPAKPKKSSIDRFMLELQKLKNYLNKGK